MMARDTQSTSTPLRFWRWWCNELSDVAQSLNRHVLTLSARMRSRRPVVTLDPAGEWIIDRTQPLGGGSMPAPTLADYLATSRQRIVSFRLPQREGFVRHIEIPRAARHDSERLAMLDVERATPFKPSDIYSTHTLTTSTRSALGFVSVCHVIVPRQVVDENVTELETFGLRVADVVYRVDASKTDLVLSRQPLTRAQSVGNTGNGLLTPALTALLILVLAIAAAITITRYDAARAALSQATTEARVASQMRRAEFEAASTAIAQTRAVEDFAAAQVSRSQVLNALARVLPDSAWLTEISIDRDVIDIAGFAKPAAELVSVFEPSEVFTDPAFTSAITKDADRDRERFSLRARLKRRDTAASLPTPTTAPESAPVPPPIASESVP